MDQLPLGLRTEEWDIWRVSRKAQRESNKNGELILEIRSFGIAQANYTTPRV